jgi:hypothetical protein
MCQILKILPYRITTLAALLAIALPGCMPETSKVRFSETMSHENGLITQRPEGFEAVSQPAGYDLTESGALRNPMQITLSLLSPGAAAHDIPRAWFGVFGLHYRITIAEGGSGGSLYNLEASKAFGICRILLQATQQSKDGTPDFLVAWALLEKTAIRASSNTERDCNQLL